MKSSQDILMKAYQVFESARKSVHMAESDNCSADVLEMKWQAYFAAEDNLRCAEASNIL